MNFLETIEEFRALGGVAHNIEIRNGVHGYGIHPVNQDEAIKIVTPPHLLISSNLLELDKNRQIKIKPKTDINPKIIDFFEKYQRLLGWGNGAEAELRQYHKELSRLPSRVQQYMLLLGWDNSDFGRKKPKDYLNEYFVSRQIRIANKSKIMPILDLINHSSSGIRYTSGTEVSVLGWFKSEVLTCYHSDFDAFHFYKNYRFFTPSYIVLSCEVKIYVPDIGLINISRLDSVMEKVNKTFVPKIVKLDDEIKISFVQLTNQKKHTSAKKIFVDGMRKINMPQSTAYEIFDGLIEHNRQTLTKFLNECRLCDNYIARELETIALNQLTLISGI